MAKWTNHVAIAVPRNGTTSHTAAPSSGTVVVGSTFTPAAGSFFVCIAVGSATASTPAGWVRNGADGGGTVIYAWSKIAVGGGSDTVTTTHNTSDVPYLFHFFEFPAGTRFGLIHAPGTITSGAANPAIGGLYGTNLVMAVKAVSDAIAASPISGVWDGSNVELLDTNVDTNGVTAGYFASIAYQEDYVSASYQPTCTVSGSGSLMEVMTFSLDVGGVNDPTGDAGSFTNHVALVAPANGSFTHTVDPSSGVPMAGTPFTPTAGRLLLCVVDGAVTTWGPGGNGTAPPDWSRLGTGESEAVNNTGLYVFWKTAAGSDTIAMTHNGSDYPVIAHFFEFPTGSTFTGSVKNASIGETQANPTLSGLTGTKFVMAAKTHGHTDPNNTYSTVWDSPNKGVLHYTHGAPNAFLISICYQAGYASATYAPTCTVLRAGNYESLTFAVDVATEPEPPPAVILQGPTRSNLILR